MANFIGLVYATLKNEGIDTNGMDTDTAVAKYNELQKKSGGKEGADQPTPAENRKLKNKPLTKKQEKDKQEREAFSNYINDKKNEIKQFQKGTANKENFFTGTIAEFKPIEKPNREPDYISTDSLGNETGSEYWFTKDGVIRGSDHWGKGISSCDWGLQGEKLKTDHITITHNNVGEKETKYGFAKWNEFLKKPDKLLLDGKEIYSNFDNLKGTEDGWEIYEINGKKYYGSKNYSVKNLYSKKP